MKMIRSILMRILYGSRWHLEEHGQSWRERRWNGSEFEYRELPEEKLEELRAFWEIK